MDPNRMLRWTGVLLILGVIAHNADHARRGLAATPDGVVWAGTLLLVLISVALTLVFTNHPLGSRAAVAVGFGAAFGVIGSHLVPHWGPVSDPLADAGVGAVTYIAVFAEIVTAVLFGCAGLYAMRQDRSGTTREPAVAASTSTVIAD